MQFQGLWVNGEHEKPTGSSVCRRPGLGLGLAGVQQADEETANRHLPEPRPS